MLTTLRSGAALLVLAASVPAQYLAARQEYAGGTTLDMTSGDLDGDGLPDIVTSGFGMAVLLHDPAGGFTTQGFYSNVNVSGAVELGHLDGDDALDVVFNITSSGIQRLGYRLGDGAGGLGPLVIVELAAFPNGLAVGDLDGDGDDDVAVGAPFLQQVLVLLSDGAGGLLPPFAVPVQDAPKDVQAGDLDDDGDLDLVTANNGADTLSVLLNDGSAAFGIATLPAPSAPTSLLVVDVDEDEALDLVVCADETVLLLGNGAGGFAPSQPLPGPMEHLRFVDVDGNGFGDLVGFGPEGLQVLFGAQGPAFVAGPAGVPPHQLNEQLLVLDANLDGLPDVLGARDSALTILRGLGFGEFESFGISECPGPPQAATTGDFDNDGDVDAAVANAANIKGGGVIVLRNEHGGHLTAVSSIGIGKLYDIETGDVDADGNADLVSASKWLGLKLQLGDGSGTYGAATAVNWEGSLDAALGDMDGDGDDDVASCWGEGATARLGYFVSDGAGGFPSQKSQVIGVTPQNVKVSDLNVDGQLDLVALAPEARLVFTVVIHGGVLGEPVTTQLLHDPRELELGQVDTDGVPDLVTLEDASSGDLFEVRLGDGTGAFAAPVSVTVSSATVDLIVEDLTGDDAAEILSVGLGLDTIALAVNDGTGSFATQEHDGGHAPLAMTTGDLTGDGLRDALVINYDGGITTTLQVLPNVGAGEPWTNVGAGKLGSSGIPMLVGHGTLQPGAPLTLELRGAAPHSAATLVIGSAPLFAPLKGGVLVPQPTALLGALVTNTQGGLVLGAEWPAGLPSGLQVWFQTWIADAGASFGLSASNGLTGTTP